MKLRFIFAAVLSSVLLAICGSASAQPINTAASQTFIRALLKPNPALWTDTAVTAYKGASALGRLNPGVAIATTILGIYLMQCSQSNFSGCIPSVQISPQNAHPDLTGGTVTVNKSTQVVAPDHVVCYDYSNNGFSLSEPSVGACVTYADTWYHNNWGCTGNLGQTVIAGGVTQIAYCYNQLARASPVCSSGATLNTTTGNCEALACPSGYTDNGNGTCSAQTGVLADGIPSTVSFPSAWGDPIAPYQDPDNSGRTQPSGLTPFQWTGTDEYGNPVTIIITPDAAGGLTFEQRTQGKYSDGSPQTLRRVVTFNPSGVKTSDTEQVYGGPITVAPPTDPSTGVAPTPVKIDFPNDYAREPTQQAVKANTDTLVQQGVDTKADRDAAKALGDTWSNPSHTDGGRNTVQGLNLPQQWTPPDTSGVIRALPQGDGSCTTLAVSLWQMPTMTLDPCPIVTVARPIINWFALALSTLAAGFAVLRGSHAEA